MQPHSQFEFSEADANGLLQIFNGYNATLSRVADNRKEVELTFNRVERKDTVKEIFDNSGLGFNSEIEVKGVFLGEKPTTSTTPSTPKGNWSQKGCLTSKGMYTRNIYICGN